MMLLAGIIGTTYAQNTSNGADKTFDLPVDHAQRRYTIDLGKGNKMQIELSNLDDLKRFANMDSLLRVFLTDIAPLKDSLGEELLSKRIDYTTDSMGRKKIRIQQFQPKGSSFLIGDGDVAALKLQQDTVNIIGTVSYTAKYTLRKAFPEIRYYRVSFFLNDLEDLQTYMDGRLSEKITAIQSTTRPQWNTTTKKGVAYLKADPSISAKLPAGYVAGGDFVFLRASADIQNYKSYFVPSFSVAAGVIIGNTHFKRDISVSWDPHFFFAKNDQNKLKTFRNDFLTLTWGQGAVKDQDPRKESHFLFVMSASYLVKREGDYFEKNTFRVGAGRLSLFDGKTKIEPAIYFNNFFKGVTPGLRLIQSF